MTDNKRYQIHIVLIDVNGRQIHPEFHTPLVHQLQPDDECVNVNIHLENDQLTIERDDTSMIRFRRPSYCPFTNLYLQKNSSAIPVDPLNSIAVGVVILLESHDRRVLLTRRASHMRTFPSCWVCPGGGVERNETLIQAGIRELREEVGIEVNADELETSRILALWESAFPVDLAHGLPRRHHVVVYVHVRSTRRSEEISIEIDPNEVDAYTWLSHDQLGAICKHTTMLDASLFSAHVHQKGMCELSLDLLSVADYNQKENLTNGTRFALEQLYLLKA